jgi:6-phosphogluconate dehydrogenase
MDVGFVGLGRMGFHMVERLLGGKHRVVAYNRTETKTRDIMKKGAEGAFSFPELAKKLPAPRTVWLMVPSGEATQATLDQIIPHLSPGDLVVDGGNSRYTDSQKRAERLKARGLHFVDVGTSGGVWGLAKGYCLMAGGDEDDFRRIEPLLATLAPGPEGYARCGPAGAGHFVKMVHNGIEYGLMQSYAEGFDLMRSSPLKLDLAKISRLWMQGSVVRSWLLELLGDALKADPSLDKLKGYVEDSGEGRWTVEEAVASGTPAPAITSALYARFASRREDSFAAKILAALRNQFGGHSVKSE